MQGVLYSNDKVPNNRSLDSNSIICLERKSKDENKEKAKWILD